MNFHTLSLATVLFLSPLGPTAWSQVRESPATRPAVARSAPQAVKAELKADRVEVLVDGKPFTEYLFRADEKYPYFFPVNGPRTGRSVTTRREPEYPHHSSLFFGCDRVNGGNYWQEGLERGRIVSQNVRLVRATGPQVVFEQDCRWERPGAEAPFDDHRVIAISAPSADARHIDFDITLTARTPVRIEKTNHSLFSARMAPDLSVKGGGTLINAQGEQGEKGTFGKPSPWADYRGSRGGETEGLAIFCHPSNPGFPPPWFTRDYGFFSPTPFYWPANGATELAQGGKLRLRYRVVVHTGAPTTAELEAWFQGWAKQ